MKVLVACEFSGIVRDAFRAAGHDAVSCDLLPSERPGPHIQADVRGHLADGWDLMVAHPPCQYLSRASARFWKKPGHLGKAQEAFAFFMELWNAPIPRVAVENPIGRAWTWFRSPDQVIEPWQFGHAVTKCTCLWLRGLPPLLYTLIVPREDVFVDWCTLGGVRKWQDRSRTFGGIAAAMANQWGDYPLGKSA